MRLPGDRDRSHGQELGFAPGPGVKQALKGQQQGYYDCGQGRHTRPLVVIWSSLPCSYNLSSFCTKSRDCETAEKAARAAAFDIAAESEVVADFLELAAEAARKRADPEAAYSRAVAASEVVLDNVVDEILGDAQ